MHRSQNRKWPKAGYLLVAAGYAATITPWTVFLYRNWVILPGGAMGAERAVIWYRRMSVIYAIGGWSVLGWTVFLIRKQKASDDGVEQKDVPRNETPVSTSETSCSKTERTELLPGLYMETYIKNAENYVPLTEKIMDYVKSWTGGPGSES